MFILLTLIQLKRRYTSVECIVNELPMVGRETFRSLALTCRFYSSTIWYHVTGWSAVVSKREGTSDQWRGVVSLKMGDNSFTAANTCKLAERKDFVRYQMRLRIDQPVTSGLYVEVM